MKYSCEIDIEKSLDEVIEAFDSFENLAKWQPSLVSCEHLSGEVGQEGAKTKLVYDENGRKMEMTETIIKRNLPEEFSARYDAKGVSNPTSNYFSGDNKGTHWKMVTDFQFTGFMKVFAFFIRGAFPKSTLKQMNYFKQFVETGKPIENNK